MTDPVQLLIEAGAIPSTPFAPQSRYSGVPLAVLQRRPDEPGLVYVRRRFIPAPNDLTIVARHVVLALDGRGAWRTGEAIRLRRPPDRSGQEPQEGESHAEASAPDEPLTG